jgi:hypothetical protein
MTHALAILTGLLLQASSTPAEGVPFESAGTLIFASAVGDVRPAGADKERAFETESRRVKKWLRIPAALDKDLQVGAYGWIKGVEKDGVVDAAEAIVFPGNSILQAGKSPQPEWIVVRFASLTGSCDHMPFVTCKPSFDGTLLVDNNRREAVTVEVERIFWSSKLDELGTSTDRLNLRLKTATGLEPLPAKIDAGAKWKILLDLPMKSGDCAAVRKNVTLVLKINGERVIVRKAGEFVIVF